MTRPRWHLLIAAAHQHLYFKGHRQGAQVGGWGSRRARVFARAWTCVCYQQMRKQPMWLHKDEEMEVLIWSESIISPKYLLCNSRAPAESARWWNTLRLCFVWASVEIFHGTLERIKQIQCGFRQLWLFGTASWPGTINSLVNELIFLPRDTYRCNCYYWHYFDKLKIIHGQWWE